MSLPFKGNTPYRSLPTIYKPLIARAFAESPSVRIRVHSQPRDVPAKFASSSFGIPRSRCFFFPPVPSARFSWAFCLASTFKITLSTIGLETSFFKKLSLNSHLEPKFLLWVVRVSLVYESNAGFSIWQLINSHRLDLTWCFFTSSFLFFLAIAASTLSMIWLATVSTWVPPREVHMEFTKLTC